MKTEKTPIEIETEKAFERLGRKVHRASKEYQLIQEGDHILVGLSGGKDSLALIELLGKRMKIFVPRFRVTAVHISVENINYRSDLEYLEHFCKPYNIPFVHHTTRFDESSDERKSRCFLCSWYRRKALFEVAENLGCNKIALGHHQDDIVETLLMNLIYQGAFATMPLKLEMDKFDMTIIRPLCLLQEQELIEFSQLRGYRRQIKNCPFEKDSSRSDVKELVAHIKTLNPDANQSIWRAMENIKPKYLPSKPTQ